MEKRLAILVVGHSNYGKSAAIKALKASLGYSKGKQYVRIGSREFFVRMMSNDDIPKGFYDFIEDLKTDPYENLIAAFCPDFVEGEKETRKCLETLQSQYDLHCWVIVHQWNSKGTIGSPELKELKKYGAKCFLYEDVKRTKKKSGNNLRQFIENL